MIHQIREIHLPNLLYKFRAASSYIYLSVMQWAMEHRVRERVQVDEAAGHVSAARPEFGDLGSASEIRAPLNAQAAPPRAGAAAIGSRSSLR